MSSANPLLSVLCLTYNHEAFVAETLESILAQDVSFEFEVIVADDCSTDGSVAVIEGFRQRFGDRLRLLRTEVNLGATRNFRRALSACRGRYVALCEGDDHWRGRVKLQRQVDFLEVSPDFVLCYHDATMIGRTEWQGRNPIPARLRRDSSQAALIATRPISTLTVCFRNVLAPLPPELDPVSYTHLDVYKRQCLCIFGKIFPGAGQCLIKRQGSRGFSEGISTANRAGRNDKGNSDQQG